MPCMNGPAISGTWCAASMEAWIERDFAVVRRSCRDLLADGSAESVFLAPWWWETMIEAGMTGSMAAEFVIVAAAGRPVLLLALQRGPDALAGLSGPYTCLYRPLLAAGMAASSIVAAAAAVARLLQAAPLCRLEAIDPDAAWLEPFLAGLHRGRLVALRFHHFGAWHEPVAGLSWEEYMAQRPGELRETVRRRLRRAAELACEIITGPDIAGGLADYERVYARSWKVPEPFPRFNAVMMGHAAAHGALRLGLLREDGQAIAAQIWLVANGRAMVAKLGHDEARKKLSPGTVLTAHMIRHLLDIERVDVLDFGRGDDPYKAAWTTRREQRIGLMLANPRRPAGALAIARHLLGGLLRKVAG